jgi:hypothetical protein
MSKVGMPRQNPYSNRHCKSEFFEPNTPRPSRWYRETSEGIL